MCGIAGMVSGPAPDHEALSRMAQAMAHRGPDGQGIWSDDRAGLAFRRLAIIDLDPRSDQPLHLGHLHLAFNGEIYDYRELREQLRSLGHEFVTEGDGEVLLHAWAQWGEAALDRVNGMFAFAVWDDRESVLTLCTDLFGEKPVYWCRDGERFVFASDIRALRVAVPGLGTPREDALAPFLGLGLMPAVDDSFFAGVRRLPGAHILRVDRHGAVAVRRYWTPREVAVPTDYENAVAQLRELLVDAIRLRLRSDVPVGTSLSGGVDSSAMVALAGSLAAGATRHAFTASFPGFGRDEWRYAAMVATAAGVREHHEVRPTTDELLGDLDALIRDQEEPFGTLSIYAQWRVNRAAREAGVTVLLDGQGGDELFGGYAGTAGWALRSQGTRTTARSLLAGTGAERTELLTALGADRLPRSVIRRHRRGRASPYVTAETVDTASRVEPAAAAGATHASPLRRELLRQSFVTSLPQLLRYADRDSMAHGREVRLPLLDRRIAEFAYSCPPRFLYDGGPTKRILRDAVKDVVPASVLERRDKVGFETPQARWLSDPAVVSRIREVLLDPSVAAYGLYDIAAIEADAHAGTWRDPSAIWRALNVELWRSASTTTSMPSRRLLVVSYYYPPDPSVGGNRWAALTEGLRALGHDVTVLTTAASGALPDDGARVLRTADLQASHALRRLMRRPALGHAGAAGAKGGAPAAGSGPPPKLLDQGIVPDAHAVTWLPGAVRSARRIVRSQQIDCVITSAPPDSVALLPLLLGRARPAWIADFRDGWRYEPLRGDWPTKTQDRLDEWLEHRVARGAEAIVGATRPIAEDFAQRLEARVVSVPNAWDPALDAAVATTGGVELDQAFVNLVHTGQLSGPRGRNPRPLFAAMRRLIDERGTAARRLRLVLVGGLDAEEERMLAELDVRDMVQVCGQQPRLRAVATQRGADALLLLTSPGHISQATGKLCEYLAAGKPIVALAKGNEAARIVVETGTGIAVAPEDVTSITGALGRILDGALPTPPPFSDLALQPYRHPAPAEAFSALVEEAIVRRKSR